MQRFNHNGKPRYPLQSRGSRSPPWGSGHGRNGNDDNKNTHQHSWRSRAGSILGGVGVVVLLLGVAYFRRSSPPPQPPKPSPVPDPELVRICNHHHKIYNLQPYYTENLDLFEVLGLDARSAVFGPPGRHKGRATAQDDARAEGVIQDAIMAQVERNLDGDGNGEAAANLRRIMVDTGLLLQNATIRKLYIDGFVPVKEKRRNQGSEKWLGWVCNNF